MKLIYCAHILIINFLTGIVIFIDYIEILSARKEYGRSPRTKKLY